MALFNGGFPVSYQPYGYGYQQYQMPMQQSMPPAQGQQSQAHGMTPPTIRTEIVQVDSQDAVDRFPMTAGMTQMMMAKDDSFIAVKSMFANGEYTVDYYDKRPPAPPKAPVDMTAFVTRDELPSLIVSIMNSGGETRAKKAPEKPAAKEASDR